MDISTLPQVAGCNWTAAGTVFSLRCPRGVMLKLQTFTARGGLKTVLYVYRDGDSRRDALRFSSRDEAMLIQAAETIARGVVNADSRQAASRYIDAVAMSRWLTVGGWRHEL